MTISVKLNDEDYIAFNIHHAFHSPQGKKTILQGRLMMSYISALAIVIFLIAGVDLMLLLCEIVFLLAASVIGYFCYPNIVRKNIRKQIGKLSQQGKLPYTKEAEIEFSDNEIVETAPTSIKHIAYQDVMCVQESEEHIYVYIGAVEAIILPKRCLEDSGEAVLDFLRKNCSQR